MDGPVRALNKLVAHLEERGHEALVFAPTSKTSYLDHAGELVSLPSIPAPGRPEYRLTLGMFGRSKKALCDFAPNLVHVAAPDLGGLAALNYAGRMLIPAVASFHTRFDTYPRYYGMPWLAGALNRYMRSFYSRCVHVYPPSQSMADELLADGIGREMRLWTRGVDSTLFNPERRDMGWRRANGINDDDIVVLFVGRLVREKGIQKFSDSIAAARQINKNIRPMIVGAGPERERFKSLAPDGVFLGHQSGEDLARAYASGDIFFNPSVTETFGQVTLEAMASGVPALCANAAGSISLVAEGETGFICPPDVEAFAPRLLQLASSKDLRAQMAAAARRRAMSYSWESVLDGLIDNYRDAIAQYHGATGTPPSADTYRKAA
ncbi:MAG: glycosyltransferase family 1 protein [Pseudomonadota bacterium]